MAQPYEAYKSDEINVTTTPTQISPNFDVQFVSVLPDGGTIEFRIWNALGWGDWIEVPDGVAFEQEFEAQHVQIRSQAGTVSVNYFLQGDPV